MLNIHRKHKRLSRGKEISVLRLFVAIGLACIDTVWAVYMNSFGLSESNIGFISAGLVVLSIGFTVFSTPIIEYFKQTKIVLISLFASVIAYFSIGFFNSIGVFLIMAAVLTITGVLRTECIDILFRDNTSKNDLNKEEGFMYMLMNVGWLIGPLVAGFFILKFGLYSVFFVAAGFFVISLILFSLSHIKQKPKKRDAYDLHYLKNIKGFFGNKNMHLPYTMATGLEVWWALSYIYVPLFMIKNGLPESSVALFLALIIIPLALFENKVGELSAKKGFRFFFLYGFIGLAIISFILFFVQNIMVQLALLVISSIFASFLEPIQDTFFFKQTSQKDEETYYPLYSTSADLGSFIGKFILAGILLFLPNNFAYLAMFVMMVFFVVMAFKIPKSSR